MVAKLKTKIRSLFFILPFVLLLSSLLTVFVPSVKVAANNPGETFTYSKDYSQIHWSDSSNYNFSKSSSDPKFYAYNSYGLCGASIQLDAARGTSGKLTTSCDGTGARRITISTPPVDIVGRWIDHSNINVDGSVYTDAKNDGTAHMEYAIQGGDSCTSQNKIYGWSDGSGHYADATVKIDLYSIPGGGNNNCVLETRNIHFIDQGNYNYYFTWQDAGTISTSDTNGLIFTNGGKGDVFLDNGSGSDGDKSCQSQITAANGETTGELILRFSGSNPLQSGWPSEIKNAQLRPDNKGCNVSKSISVKIADPVDDSGKHASEKEAGSSSVGGGTDGHDPNATCETGGFGLNWILCPIFNTVADFSDWLFKQVVEPFLRTAPISTNPADCKNGHGDCSYQIWSSFRIYGDIFLVITLIVVVFGQSIGGGMIDAYTAKKVLPRLLGAAILINLSIYIVAALVDLTNIIGGGIGSIMTAPLANAGAFHISPSGVQAGEVIGIAGGIAAILTTGSGFVGALIGVKAIPFILLMVVMPVVLGLLAAFVTLILRKAAILALVLVSPVAFALYCLPNTEKYFRKWWELLLQMLAVYPIVIVFFAVADILSVTVMNANGKANALAPIIAFVLQFLPLVFIPYAFRLAGGAIGRLHEVVTGGHKRMQEAIKGNPNDPWSLRNRAKRNVTNKALMNREKLMVAANARKNRGGLYGVRARLAQGMFANDVLRAKMNAESGEMSKNLVGSGDDWRYRAGFARKLNYQRALKDKDGNITGFEPAVGWFGTGAEDDGNGNLIQDAQGRHRGQQFSSVQVRQSRAFMGSDPSHYQAGLVYELGSKAGDESEVVRTLEAHNSNMESMKVKEQETPMWVGTVFTTQQKFKDLKHTRKNNKGNWERDSYTNTREVAEDINNYSLSNMRAQTVDSLTKDYLHAQAYLQGDQATIDAINNSGPIKIKPLRDRAEAEAVMTNVRQTADSLNQRMMSGGVLNSGGDEAQGTPGQPVSGAATGAAGRVQEAINTLVRTAGTPRGQQQP